MKNLGYTKATNVVLQEFIDSNARFIKAKASRGSVALVGNLLKWTIGTLDVNASVVITITLRARNPGIVALDAFVSGAEVAKKNVNVLRRPRLSLWLPDLRRI